MGPLPPLTSSMDAESRRLGKQYLREAAELYCTIAELDAKDQQLEEHGNNEDEETIGHGVILKGM
jgi:hypothetical protein